MIDKKIYGMTQIILQNRRPYNLWKFFDCKRMFKSTERSVIQR